LLVVHLVIFIILMKMKIRFLNAVPYKIQI